MDLRHLLEQQFVRSQCSRGAGKCELFPLLGMQYQSGRQGFHPHPSPLPEGEGTLKLFRLRLLIRDRFTGPRMTASDTMQYIVARNTFRNRTRHFTNNVAERETHWR